jgi:hypothetical protein
MHIDKMDYIQIPRFDTSLKWKNVCDNRERKHKTRRGHAQNIMILAHIPILSTVSQNCIIKLDHIILKAVHKLLYMLFLVF